MGSQVFSSGLGELLLCAMLQHRVLDVPRRSLMSVYLLTVPRGCLAPRPSGGCSFSMQCWCKYPGVVIIMAHRNTCLSTAVLYQQEFTSSMPRDFSRSQFVPGRYLITTQLGLQMQKYADSTVRSLGMQARGLGTCSASFRKGWHLLSLLFADIQFHAVCRWLQPPQLSALWLRHCLSAVNLGSQHGAQEQSFRLHLHCVTAP